VSPKEGWYRDPVAERWWDGAEWTNLVRTTGDSHDDGPISVDNTDQPAGWLPDPIAERFWNGSQWTAETRQQGSLPSPVIPRSPQATSSRPSTPSPSATSNASAISPASKKKSGAGRRYKAVAIVAGVIALIAVGTVLFVGSRNDDGGNDEAVLDIPVGATPVSTMGGYLRPQPATPISLSVASCGGLLAKVDAAQCIEASIGGVQHALVFVDDGVEVFVSVFRISTKESVIETQQVLSGTIGLSERLNTEIALHAYVLRLSTGAAFALLVEEISMDTVTTTVEFVGASSVGVISTVGVYQGSGIDLAVDIDRVFVAKERESSTNDNSLVSTIFPDKDGWLEVEEVLSISALDSLLRGREAVLFRSSTDGFEPPPPSTTTTTTTTTTTLPPTTTTIPTSGLISGASIACDGSWMTIVSSQTFERTQSVLDKFPGAFAVKNEEACASLNPTFTRGSDAGKPIYVVFYGPYFDRYDAQGQCLNLGRTTMSQCYVAPLTNNVADRSIRLGPTD
jgi:hypothetical protein